MFALLKMLLPSWLIIILNILGIQTQTLYIHSY